MRKLTNARDREHAQRIVDHLLVRGIDAEARADDGTEVWVLDDDDMAAAREHVAAIETTGGDARTEAAKIRRERERDAQAHAQRFQDVRRRWRDVAALGAGPITMSLIAGSLVVAVLRYLAEGSADPASDPMWTITIDHYTSEVPLGRVRAGEVWRLVTPMFLHFGLFHLLFNMLWLNRLGRQVEHGHGALVMVTLVIVSEVVGNLGQYWVSGPAFGGMSGVVYALFGFVWMNARYSRSRQYALSDMSTLLIMGWFVACATGMFGPIANIGHAGGLVVGLAFGLPPYVRHLRASTTPEFEGKGWAATQMTGFRRFRRRYITPYVPLWFLALAAIVIAAEQADHL